MPTRGALRTSPLPSIIYTIGSLAVLSPPIHTIPLHLTLFPMQTKTLVSFQSIRYREVPPPLLQESLYPPSSQPVAGTTPSRVPLRLLKMINKCRAVSKLHPPCIGLLHSYLLPSSKMKSSSTCLITHDEVAGVWAPQITCLRSFRVANKSRPLKQQGQPPTHPACDGCPKTQRVQNCTLIALQATSHFQLPLRLSQHLAVGRLQIVLAWDLV